MADGKKISLRWKFGELLIFSVNFYATYPSRKILMFVTTWKYSNFSEFSFITCRSETSKACFFSPRFYWIGK